MIFHKQSHLRGEIDIPGDKSISHRAIMFGALANKTTRVRNFLKGADCFSTINAFKSMGIAIEENPGEILVHGKGLYGLSKPLHTLDMGNSGTTTRLISGILSGQKFQSTLDGDASLKQRPMRRIMEPLSLMGADITSLNGNDCLPLTISGKSLHGINYTSKVSSAQVKSAIMLAGLYADSPVSVTEPALSRNHTELMLRSFGADVTSKGLTVTISPAPTLTAIDILVPGDISSAAYFIAAGLITPDSEILIKNVGINPTRDGILKVAKAMGADITLLNKRELTGEPACDLLVRTSKLHGTKISGDLIPTLIDELPVIAVMACHAKGTTIIADASELKVKESDRIAVMTENLKAMGAEVTPTPDGMIIQGGNTLKGAVIDSHLDHRIAMSFAVAALTAEGETKITGSECVNISYPGFYTDLSSLYKPL